MKWRKTDFEKYIQAKEYIDTILMPLIPFQMSNNDEESEKSAAQAEIMTVFANEVEKELTGRIMLAPSYYYLKSSNKATEAERMNKWMEKINEQPFSHIILLTFDPGWKKHEQELDGNLLWMPAVHAGEIKSKEMQRIIREQVGQTIELIRGLWE